MVNQTFKDFEISPDAILNKEFPGFEQDYIVLDSLLRKYNPKSVFEIGCNFGSGTNIICNAVPYAKVYSLDLPYGEGDAPLYIGYDHTGENCKRPFTLLRGDSITFEYHKYPCEAYYVDGGHFYKNVLSETIKILELKPKLVIYHDTDIPEVMGALITGIETSFEKINYEVYKVTDTRISYLLRK